MGDLSALGWFVVAAAVLGTVAFAFFLSLAARRPSTPQRHDGEFRGAGAEVGDLQGVTAD